MNTARPSGPAHPVAIEFRNFSGFAVDGTTVPGPEVQVHQQRPHNGLYFRKSGRLLTSEKEGDLVERVRAGLGKVSFFELQRVGQVTRQEPLIATRRRINPVYCLANPRSSEFVAIRWVDEDGLHEAVPQNRVEHDVRLPLSVTVLSWLAATVVCSEFQADPTASVDTKTHSTASAEDPMSGFLYRAMHAYGAIQPAVRTD